jgi:hypothetical protein
MSFCSLLSLSTIPTTCQSVSKKRMAARTVELLVECVAAPQASAMSKYAWFLCSITSEVPLSTTRTVTVFGVLAGGRP